MGMGREVGHPSPRVSGGVSPSRESTSRVHPRLREQHCCFHTPFFFLAQRIFRRKPGRGTEPTNTDNLVQFVTFSLNIVITKNPFVGDFHVLCFLKLQAVK